MKSLVKYVLLVVSIVAIIFAVNYKFPNHAYYLDNKLLDLFFVTRDAVDFKNNVTVIEIDDKSINKIGQWPWSRNTIAKLIQNINSFSPAVIGFSIIFSESDRTSPSNFISNESVEVDNYDEILGITIEDSNVPIVLGYTFLNYKSNKQNHIVPYVPAVYKSKISKDKIHFIKPNDALLNIPFIQDASYSSGFLNSIYDETGRMVAMPMLMEYKEQLLPSLALELVRTIYSSRQIYILNNKILENHIQIEDIKIPIDNSSSMLVNYIKEYDSIKHISAVDILNKNYSNFSLSDISNKIILIGANASGMSINTPTPFNENISSLDIQALTIENILSNNYLTKPSWVKDMNYIATIIIVMIIIATIFYGSIMLNLISAIIITIASYFILFYYFQNSGYIISVVYITEAILLSLLISIIGHFFRNKADMSKIKGKFASKVSKQVMDDLLNTSNEKRDLSSKRKEVSIFFSDIKSFTKITQKIDDPQKLTTYINRYMDAMTKNIMLSEGTVDKFMGDAIMAYWNAPNDVVNHADKALSSAIEQIILLNDINELNIKEKLPLIQIRIGINYGEVFVGEVGSELRSDYTIMGKNVNHAAVLEQAGKYYSANIIISQKLKDNLQNYYVMLLIDLMQVDGTSDAFNIYQVFEKGKGNKFVNDTIIQFEKAISLYRQAEIDDAILIFRNLLLNENLPNKKICSIYIKRCENAYLEIQNSNFNPIQSINKSFISG